MDENEPPTENAGFRFGIRTLLWVTAVLSAGMATLGPALGGYSAVLVIVSYLLWRDCRKNRPRIASLLLAPLLIHVLIAFLLLVVSPARRAALESANQGRSTWDLKQLVLGMHRYHDVYGHFPPPFSTDDNGRLLHSWRTLLLPYIEEKAVYKNIQLDEAWNGPNNKSFLEKLQIPALRSTREAAREAAVDETHYLAIVDKQTVWSPNQTIKLAGIFDGTTNTIVLIEVAGREIPWYEPRDLTLDEAITILADEGDGEWIRPGFFVSDRLRGDGIKRRIVAYADGHVGTISHYSPDRETARAFLTRSGGENLEGLVNRTSQRKTKVIGHIVHWGRIWGVAVFVALAVGPFFIRRKTI